MLTKGFRWYLLVNSSGTKVKFTKTFPYYIIALALNNLTPGKIGGEPVRAYLLKAEEKVPVGQSIASIFAEKIMDMIIISTMAVIGAFFIIPLLTPTAARFLIIILAAVIGSIVVAIIIISNSNLLKRTMDKSVTIAQKVSKKDSVIKLTDAITGFIERFRFGMNQILKAKRNAATCISLTVIIWINESLRLFIILLALPNVVGISLGGVFIAASIANILGITLPGGAGNILGIGTVFLALGMDPNHATAASILHVATSIWISVPFGVIAMMLTGFRFSKMNK